MPSTTACQAAKNKEKKKDGSGVRIFPHAGDLARSLSNMNNAQIIVATAALVLTFVLYTAWMNGLFLRCPYCGKIGFWRYDAAEPPVEEKDEDGVVQKSPQIRICRKCAERVLDKWSDHEGHTFEKTS
jgi:hypothetical protein